MKLLEFMSESPVLTVIVIILVLGAVVRVVEVLSCSV